MSSEGKASYPTDVVRGIPSPAERKSQARERLSVRRPDRTHGMRQERTRQSGGSRHGRHRSGRGADTWDDAKLEPSKAYISRALRVTRRNAPCHPTSWNPRSARTTASASRGVRPTGTTTETLPNLGSLSDHFITRVAGESSSGVGASRTT